VHRHSLRLDQVHERVGDLLAHPLLHSEPACEQPNETCQLRDPDDRVAGDVPDVRPYLARAAAVAAPLRVARGIQNKVLEAMAMVKPLVATHDATRSLAVEAGTHLWVANQPEQFAQAVVEALTGPRREEIAGNGRSYVESHHSWPDLLQQVDRHLEALNPAHQTGTVPRAAGGQRLELSARYKS